MGGMLAPAPEEASGGVHDLGFFELFRRWQLYLDVSGRCNGNTARQYRRYVLAFFADVIADPERFPEVRQPADVTEDDVVEYVKNLDPKGGMRAQVLKALHSFYGWAERRCELPHNPVRAIPIPRRKYGRAPTLAREERLRLFAAAELVDPRARPTFELMYNTGARIGSIVEVLPADVYWVTEGGRRRRWLDFRRAKGDRPYRVPLNAEASAAVDRLLELADYVPKRGKRRPTLVGVGEQRIRDWIDEAEARSGVRAWPHLLRHAFATDLRDVDDRTWASLMNHRDASLRSRYVPPPEDRMGAGVDALG